ncbi:MFS transporter [Pelosinus propionicus]|uniref:Sugar phosphate permease n=1 Tax=Pelosinus propionicus DSM 13327 TaxID=1123291 RepID=A0A1I4ITV9_9FIRM|nr:MFS transporter [Pelosinus propionicus]SFL57730.1 Sugar phosphate permease [Pelosinus propionicus DSM 13327]
MNLQPAKSQNEFWIVILTGMLLIITTTGFVRMAYGVVLPYMQVNLSLSFSEVGMLGTFMFLGYLLTVGMSGVLAVRWGAKAVLLLGGWSVTISLFSLAYGSSFWWVSLFMFTAGAGSALVFTPLMSLTIGCFPDRRGMVLGFLLSGAGIGMLLNGILVPNIVKLFPELGWRAVWLLFGILSLSVIILAIQVLKDPSYINKKDSNEGKPKWLHNKELIKIAWLYFLVGVGYLIPILYQTIYMIELGISDKIAGGVFAVAGVFAIMGGPAWGAISDKIGSQKTLMIALLWAIIGDVIPIISHHVASFIVSAVIWGSSIGGILALIQVKASHQVPQKYISAAIGFISAFYAIGQMLGPGLAGWLIEYYGGFASAYCFGALTYFIGLLMTLSLKKETERMNVAGAKESQP